jgi:prolyl-tRNA synthetase
MKLSKHVGKTLREVPRDAQTVAHQLMLRAGFIKQTAAGIYSYLPLGFRTLNKISSIVRQEMDRIGAEELLMPALQPRELWEESGRWERYTEVDGIMFTLEDRRKGVVCLGPTHEEVITDIIRREVTSYKELPVIPYQIQTKFRDEIRPRFGLMRAREFIMKDAYSFDTDYQGLDTSFEAMESAYHQVCKRIGLKYRAVEADAGAIGGSGSKEFMALADTGEDTIISCDSCDYAANLERAESIIKVYEQDEAQLPLEEVLGENIIGVEALAKFLGVPVWKTTKTILFQTENSYVAVMVRGDCEVSEIKVANYLNVKQLTLCTPEQIEDLTGAKVGYAGPLGLPKHVKLLADSYCEGRTNFECGANRTGYHSINVNFGRDLEKPFFGDFKSAELGHNCIRCKTGTLQSAKGIEVGHIFKLGTKYSEAMGCSYLNKEGESIPMVMGCYGIGVSRIVAAVIEQSHDEKGIIWPRNIAPYHIHLVGLNLEVDHIRAQCEELYQTLVSQSYEVLYDDRDMRAGEKFSDSDLIGLPLRITLSSRSIQNGGVEWKERNSKDSSVVSFDSLAKRLGDYFAS